MFMVDRPLGREVFWFHGVQEVLSPTPLKVVDAFVLSDMSNHSLAMWKKLIVNCSEKKKRHTVVKIKSLLIDL